MPLNKITKGKSKESLVSLKDTYQDIFSRLCNDRELGILSNELAVTASGLMAQLGQSNSISYYLPENNEDVCSMVYDAIKVVDKLKTVSLNRFDAVSSTTITNQTMALDIAFSIILWDEFRKMFRPDIEQSIFENLDKDIRDKIDELAKELLVSTKDMAGTGLGLRVLKSGQCTRDCTKCPIAHNFSVEEDDVLLYTKARCPIFLGRQSFLVARVFAQVQVMYRSSTYPFRNSTGKFFLTEEKMLNPVEFFTERVNYLNSMLDLSFPDKRIEEQGNIIYFISSYHENYNDVITSLVLGQISSYIPA